MADDLVTGATGLVGANLVHALVARGRRVRVLVRPGAETRYLVDPAVEPVTGDVEDLASVERACDGVEHVYHCAALVSMWARRAAAMQRVNVGGTANVLAAVRRAGVRRLVHCSTVDAIGLRPDAVPATEDVPWNWDALGIATPYARTKLAAQRLVLAAAAAEVDAVVVNPTYMFGALDLKPSSGRMILEIAAGRAVGWPAGGNNVVDVEDVVDAMIAAAARGRRGACYILGAWNLTYREIFAEIAAAVGRPAPRRAIPWPLARLAGFAGDLAGAVTGREPSVNSATVALGWVDHWYDPTRARRELGLRRTPIRVALDRAVAWFRQTGRLR